ncbi:MAG: hypothetical protein A3J10_01200 [Candidatus Sungbacteria bacterium RIFCSPLOWO2_02_FULL_54_10]|nr:MAG: hypothetical protein A3J10_01200 [Candidatus Sungbacteria bacterium RIFCSPLOWO2_02_FULL_54_10]
MKTYDHLIIGGGIAGVTAAETIRSRDADAAIGIISHEPHFLYSRVLLPAYIKKKIRREQIFLRTEDDFIQRGIDLLRGRTAERVDTAARRVVLADGEEIGYGKLLISAGGRVQAWTHGKAEQNIFRLQTLDDADRLSVALDTVRRPVVVGSSFIALEFIETFLLRSIAPRVLVRGPHLFDTMLDEDGASLLDEHLTQKGAELIYSDEISGLAHQGALVQIETHRGNILETDALGVGIGVARNISFLEGSGIACGRGVYTDALLETNVPGVFAGGDIAEYFDTRLQRRVMVGNWTNAMLQGRHAGLNMTGAKIPFYAVPTYSIVNLGLNITALGECDGTLESVSRMDRTTRRYERFFMRDGVLVGAFLINQFADKPFLTELIARGVVVAPYAERLNDMSFDIRAISAIMQKRI